MTEWMQIVFLLAVIGLLIVTPVPMMMPQGPKPKPGDEVCPMCKRALLEAHHHGVTILPRPKGPRPSAVPMPSQKPVVVGGGGETGPSSDRPPVD